VVRKITATDWLLSASIKLVVRVVVVKVAIHKELIKRRKDHWLFVKRVEKGFSMSQ